MCFRNSDRNLRNLETNSVALRIPKKADMKLLLVILVLIGFVSSGDPCKEGLDDSICTDGAKTGRLVARLKRHYDELLTHSRHQSYDCIMVFTMIGLKFSISL